MTADSSVPGLSDRALMAAAGLHHRLHCAACIQGRACDGPDEDDREAARMIITAALVAAFAEAS